MLLLLPLLWLWSVWARDEDSDASLPKDSKYVIHQMESCPEVGYFFRRESSPNGLTGFQCYLCFCQNDGTAVCWKRENKRCDVRHYKHGSRKTADRRVRRSPIGISDIFFRDATREIFNKQVKAVCKPYETSFSEGCPPADWCTGCTVCDCDANGHWDCHILSFCPDKKDKNKLKRNKKPINKTTALDELISKPTKKQTTTKTTKNPAPSHRASNTNIKRHKFTRKIKPNQNIQKKNNASPKPLIIKKNTEVKKPVVIKKDQKKSPVTINKNETAKITQEVYKRLASAVHKIISKKFAANMDSLKNLQKRSLEKKTQPCVRNSKNAKKNMNGKLERVGYKTQYKKTINMKASTQKKYVPSKNKPVPSKYTKQNNKVKRNIPSGNAKKVTLKLPNPTKRSWRTKRESTVNITDITNSSLVNTEYFNITPEVTPPENNVVRNDTNHAMYYKYTVFPPKPLNNMTNNPKYETIHVNIVNDLNTGNAINIHDTLIDIQDKKDEVKSDPEVQASVPIIANIEPKYNNLTFDDIASDYNDLKFNKRPQVKFMKNSRLLKMLFPRKGKINNESIANTSEREEETPTNSSKHNDVVTHQGEMREILRFITPNPYRRYNMSKVVNNIRSTIRNLDKAKNARSFQEHIFNKINDIQGTLKRLLNELRKNNSTVKPKRFSVLKYLKKFFRKLFKKRTGKGVISINNKKVFTNHVIKTICDSFGDCDRTQINNPILNKKVKGLYIDTLTILKTINIIKGLLHFLNDTEHLSNSYDHNLKTDDKNIKANFNEDIKKLSAILKDDFICNNKNLTNTQITQIKYIKKNTNAFITYVAKFASKLNEIVTILTKKTCEVKKRPITREIKRKPPKFDLNYYMKLRDLFDKYAVLQGMLVQKMRQSLDKYEDTTDEVAKDAMVSGNRDSKTAILHYSNNVIKNLKKLKTLADLLTKTRNGGRREKRDAMRDSDTMEYLLTLMEYLLKQNIPLDAAPVNDGIDLLIEAIKNAPDIKTIKKKVLQTTPVADSKSENTDSPPRLSREDNSEDINKISKEENVINDTKNTSSEVVEAVSFLDEDQPPQSRLTLDDANTEGVYYNRNSEDINAMILDTTVAPRAYNSTIQESYTTEHNNFEKLEKAVEDDTKKIEVFIGDVEDEDSPMDVTSPSVVDVGNEMESVTVNVPMEIDFKLQEIKERQKNVKSDSSTYDGNKQVALEWLDEGEEQDIKEVTLAQNTTSTPVATKKPKTVLTTSKPVDNISSITKEIIDEEDSRRRKANIEEISYKKQMDLLNSLDYGTEKPEGEQSESKDGDERYSGDVFQTYF